jgi:hypothetical protein
VFSGKGDETFLTQLNVTQILCTKLRYGMKQDHSKQLFCLFDCGEEKCKLNFHSCFIFARLHMSKIHLIGRHVDTYIRQEFVTDLWYLSSFQYSLF